MFKFGSAKFKDDYNDYNSDNDNDNVWLIIVGFFSYIDFFLNYIEFFAQAEIITTIFLNKTNSSLVIYKRSN